MRKLSHAEITEQRSTLKNIADVKKLPVYVVLDSIRSSYNVGSIFRTSDGVMVEKIFLCGYTPTPENKEVFKTALGSQESVKWEYVKDPKEVITKLKAEGIKISALELTEKSTSYSQVNSGNFPLCLIVGNEVAGVSQDLLDMCDFTIEITQYGIKQSLNVGVAYGISIFELRRIFELSDQISPE